MGETHTGTTVYAEYLKLDDLLAAQQQRSEHPDELQFIIVHQVHELWFKLILHQLGRLRAAMQDNQLVEAVRLAGQVIDIFRNLRYATEHLQTLPPVAFHSFRAFLASGSGMQSFQFREIEIVLGRRDEKYLKWVGNTLVEDSHFKLVEARLVEQSIADTLTDLLARQGVTDCADVYAHPERHSELYALADAFSVLEHQIIVWRTAHIQLVERTIGVATVGTGGTSHDYLQKASQARFFPMLWEARNELSRRVDAGEV
jgi:tryptophan 2,3-dioxygenase